MCNKTRRGWSHLEQVALKMWKLCFINRTTPPKFNVSPLRKDEPLNFRSVGSWLFSHYVAAPFLNRIFFGRLDFACRILCLNQELFRWDTLAVLRHLLWQKMMSRLCTNGVSHPILDARTVHFRNCIFRFYLFFVVFNPIDTASKRRPWMILPSSMSCHLNFDQMWCLGFLWTLQGGPLL